MNQEERVEYHQETETYFEKNQIKDLFHQMTIQCLQKMPEDPIDFFIKILKQRSIKKVICIVGNDPKLNDKVSNMIAQDFHYQPIDIVEDQQVTALGNLRSTTYDEHLEVINKGTDKKGFLFKNFPNNINQALWMAKNRIVPERIFMITHPNMSGLKRSSDGTFLDAKVSRDIENIRDVNFDLLRDFYKDVIYDFDGEQIQSSDDEMTIFKVIRNIMTIRHRE